MGANDNYPLMRLEPPRSVSRKRVPPRFPPPPSRDRPAHGRALLAGARDAMARIAAAAAVSPALATDVPYLRVTPSKGSLVSDDDLKRLGLVPVMHRVDGAIAAFGTDGRMKALSGKVAEYVRGTAKHDFISRIDSLTAWSREDRTSGQLEKLGPLQPTRRYVVDVVLLPMEGGRPATAALRRIESYVLERGGSVLDRHRSKSLTAARIGLGGQALEQLLEHRADIATIQLPPTAQVSVPQIISFNLDDLPEIPLPSDSAPAICVVDSGILEAHPAMLPRSKSYPAKLGSPVPPAGTEAAAHGTGVAGVALYGDVASCADRKQFEPAAWLINARMLDDNNRLDPDHMPFVRGIVEDVDGTSLDEEHAQWTSIAGRVLTSILAWVAASRSALRPRTGPPSGAV